jgi:pSer/pThr/pTyr-binding forkhead associated (FHA) protein
MAMALHTLAPGRYLAVESGHDHAVARIEKAVVRVGRSPGADVFLDDASVSRRHALLVQRGRRTLVLDDRSLNGVLVNGRRVDEAVLRDGDVLVLGRVVLRYMQVAD